MRCRLCAGKLGEDLLEVEERMFGMGGAFAYARCDDCGSLNLLDPPAEPAGYYPDTYYSLAPAATSSRLSPLRALRRAAISAGVPPRMAFRGEPPPSVEWLQGVWPWHRILDFGSGSGSLANDLRRQGFRRTIAVDPYASSNSVLPEVPKGTRFDFVMFHHALEHVDDPQRVLSGIVEAHLAERGRVLIRIPVADSWAFRHYRERWVQIDAPRHLFVPTRDGVRALAARCGLTVTRTVFDSGPLQFWGSDRYVNGEPLGTPPSGAAELEARAAALNRAADGDQAAFYLARVPETGGVGRSGESTRR